jgi:hypothetical protein
MKGTQFPYLIRLRTSATSATPRLARSNRREIGAGWAASAASEIDQRCDLDQKCPARHDWRWVFRGIISWMIQKPSPEMARGSLRMNTDLESTLRWAHEANLERYRRLLETCLTDNERQFVKRRIAEEREALRQVGGKMHHLLPQPD